MGDVPRSDSRSLVDGATLTYKYCKDGVTYGNRCAFAHGVSELVRLVCSAADVWSIGGEA